MKPEATPDTTSAPSYMPSFDGALMSLNELSSTRGHKPLFKGVTLTAAQPGIIWVTGANGSGKTTLLRICAGLTRPDAGSVTWQIGGQAVPASQMVSYQPPQGFAKSGLSLAEDFNFWSRLNKSKAAPSATNLKALSQTGLTAHTSTQTQHLSTGQKRRLGLARLLTDNKPIWILDEPMAGLDQQGRELLVDIVSAHITRGGIAMIASHNPVSIDGVNARQMTLTPPPENTNEVSS